MKTSLKLALVLLFLCTPSARAASLIYLYRAYDAKTGLEVARGDVPDAKQTAPLALIGPGSTLKPFLLSVALAGGLDPNRTLTCPKSRIEISPDKRCWLAEGHGPVNLVQALAQSCTTYARHACSFVDADRYRDLLIKFVLGTRLPDRDAFRAAGPEAWIGNKSVFLVTPEELALAYNAAFGTGKLHGQSLPSLPGRDLLLQGLRECCLTGTGKAVRESAPLLDVIGKTGTSKISTGAPCGLFIALAPANQPRIAFVLVVLNASGAEAAALAGKTLPNILSR